MGSAIHVELNGSRSLLRIALVVIAIDSQQASAMNEVNLESLGHQQRPLEYVGRRRHKRTTQGRVLEQRAASMMSTAHSHA